MFQLNTSEELFNMQSVVQNTILNFSIVRVHFQKEWMSKIEGAVTTLLNMDSEQPRVKSSTLWLESSQI